MKIELKKMIGIAVLVSTIVLGNSLKKETADCEVSVFSDKLSVNEITQKKLEVNNLVSKEVKYESVRDLNKGFFFFDALDEAKKTKGCKEVKIYLTKEDGHIEERIFEFESL